MSTIDPDTAASRRLFLNGNIRRASFYILTGLFLYISPLLPYTLAPGPVDHTVITSRPESGSCIQSGDHMAYGFVVSGVEEWTVTGNVDLSTHLIPEEETDCFGEPVDPPGGFQYNPMTTYATLQAEFVPAELGFTNQMWPFQTVASESCLAGLIGEALLDSIRDGMKGPVWPALEDAPNGELIGRCVGLYEPPDISGLTGDVMVAIDDSCVPTCIDLVLYNLSETDTASLERAEFLMNDFVVPCTDLPSFIGPWEEARCTIDDYVAGGFNVVNWYGFQPESGGAGFDYPYDPVIIEPERIGPSFPRTFDLSQNRPNPFNPSTSIDYTIPEGEQVPVRLEIFDLRGRWVRTLVDDERAPGRHAVHWDGKDWRGIEVGSGLYLYRIEAGGFASIRKMTVVR